MINVPLANGSYTITRNLVNYKKIKATHPHTIQIPMTMAHNPLLRVSATKGILNLITNL